MKGKNRCNEGCQCGRCSSSRICSDHTCGIDAKPKLWPIKLSMASAALVYSSILPCTIHFHNAACLFKHDFGLPNPNNPNTLNTNITYNSFQNISGFDWSDVLLKK